MELASTEAMELASTEARRLDKFIHDRLQPDEVFLGQVRDAIRTVCEFLKENCFTDATCPIDPRPRVLKVVKGGSSGKGTALKTGSDADLVLFLSIFRGYTDQERDRKVIIREIEQRLRECQQEKRLEVQFERSKWKNPRVLSFKLRSRDARVEDYIDFDVLPAFDALGHYSGLQPDPQVYLDLIRSSHGMGSLFSPCFTELQRDFIRDRPTKLKSLIRLLKHWYKQLPEESLPPKYGLELLAVYAWEKGCGQTAFNMAEGFRTVLWLLQQHRQLCIFWTRFYDFENRELGRFLQSQLRKPRPILLDPADPTGIIGEGKRWDVFARHAADWAFQKCCRNFDGSLVEPWRVLAFDPGLALCATEAAQLDEFVTGSVQPSRASLDQARSLVDAVCTFLRDGCFKDAPKPWPRVMKIVKGGSLGNGTALKGGVEADLVLFLNTITDYAEQEREGERAVQKIAERLGQGRLQGRTEVEIGPMRRSRTGHGLDFTVRSWKRGESLEFHVLPAFDALGQGAKGGRPDPQVYLDLIRSSHGKGSQFSPCFTELQRDFVRDRPPKLKSLIRLLKHWYKQCIYPRESELRDGEYLPPGYALELLAVYAWEKGCGQTAFDMAEGFRTVLWLLQQHRQLCIFWTRFYDFENGELGRFLQSQLRKPRSVPCAFLPHRCDCCSPPPARPPLARVRSCALHHPVLSFLQLW